GPAGQAGEGGPWLAGAQFSLADINMAPYVARMEYLNLIDLWMRARPRTEAWWRRIKQRPSFRVLDGRLTEEEKATMRKSGSAIRPQVAARLDEYLASLASAGKASR
ncbi:MAG: glutathione S-transferase family protein, partial [Pseudomonadota bacterium]